MVTMVTMDTMVTMVIKVTMVTMVIHGHYDHHGHHGHHGHPPPHCELSGSQASSAAGSSIVCHASSALTQTEMHRTAQVELHMHLTNKILHMYLTQTEMHPTVHAFHKQIFYISFDETKNNCTCLSPKLKCIALYKCTTNRTEMQMHKNFTKN